MRTKRTLLLVLMAAFFVGQGFLHHSAIFPRWRKDYSANQGSLGTAGLNPDQLLFALIGLREFVAGILWVRADSFFDTGNYDAILPIIRLVTWLDPKQIDVYATGMWHIGYNFTDEDQRSDRRYIPSALALGKEGARQNPHTYEMFFETGWMWYHKIDDDYDRAVEWFLEAHERPDMLPARKNLLSNAYQRAGEVDKAAELYFDLHKAAVKRVQNEPEVFGHLQNLETLENNLDTMLVRMVQRGYVAKNRNDGSFETGAYDVNPPFDVGFSAKVTVVEPRVIQIEGTWNVLPVGTRVRAVLRDADYETDKAAALHWDKTSSVNLDPPRDKTFMQEQLFVKNRRFNRTIDMSKDPTMYPFTSKDYVLEFYYNPRSAPPHIQDKFGWSGEGMTDKNFLNTEVRPGQRVVYTKMSLTREQLLRQGEWNPIDGKVPILRTKNYVEAGQSAQDDLIIVPQLRGAGQ
ncbi:MAG TPA: hypothetical protein VM328_09215 [Fimbriimonadaceae bacterium]|nr:hypothetical protein [Fimbriimonadaceae bacterium]